MRASARVSAAGPQGRDEIAAAGAQSRYQTEQEAGDDRQAGCERQDRCIHWDRRGVGTETRKARCADAKHERVVAWIHGEQHANDAEASEESQDTASGSKHEALGHQLAYEASPPGADRGTNRHLAPARGRAHEQKTGDVRACDEENERHGARQQQNRPASVSHHGLA